MFGEYGLYCDRKFFGLVCDNQLYVKITEPGLNMLPRQEQGSPYPGARPHFLMTELDNDRALSSLVRETCSVLAAPEVLAGKKKKRLEKKEAGVRRRLPGKKGWPFGGKGYFSGASGTAREERLFFRLAATV